MLASTFLQTRVFLYANGKVIYIQMKREFSPATHDVGDPNLRGVRWKFKVSKLLEIQEKKLRCRNHQLHIVDHFIYNFDPFVGMFDKLF